MDTTKLQALKSELQSDPSALGYAVLLPSSPGVVVEKLNTISTSYTKLVTRLIGIGTVLDALGPETGAQVLNTVEGLKNSNAVIKWAWYLLEKGELDVSLQSTRQQLDLLAQTGVISQQHATTLKNLANQPASRAEHLFGQMITEADIRAAQEI